jgi:hypothetical protein
VAGALVQNLEAQAQILEPQSIDNDPP